ncbi:hypothetical protein [Neobacillus niacini]|uniref:hypothetical protein n=1 Tax=Neobacillus niacini TaxID=86668 RepID=UPI0021CB4E5D|nr:hypothetical protein [Neobacillus niacini]MCM3765528.1 hypothetical protein [Neobacillus niacini]
MDVNLFIDLLKVIFINLIMSVDSALIIGIVVRELPIESKKGNVFWCGQSSGVVRTSSFLSTVILKYPSSGLWRSRNPHLSIRFNDHGGTSRLLPYLFKFDFHTWYPDVRSDGQKT